MTMTNTDQKTMFAAGIVGCVPAGRVHAADRIGDEWQLLWTDDEEVDDPDRSGREAQCPQQLAQTNRQRRSALDEHRRRFALCRRGRPGADLSGGGATVPPPDTGRVPVGFGSTAWPGPAAVSTGAGSISVGAASIVWRGDDGSEGGGDRLHPGVVVGTSSVARHAGSEAPSTAGRPRRSPTVSEQHRRSRCNCRRAQARCRHLRRC